MDDFIKLGTFLKIIGPHSSVKICSSTENFDVLFDSATTCLNFLSGHRYLDCVVLSVTVIKDYLFIIIS